MVRKIITAKVEPQHPEELILELTGGVTILLSLKPKKHDFKFAQIMAQPSPPQTDGKRVYWANGASLSVKEIMTMLCKENDSEIN